MTEETSPRTTPRTGPAGIDSLPDDQARLKAANEELSTVNAELQDKINELEHANGDLTNLFAGLDTGVLFLDRGLCIKRYTAAVKPLINLIETDIGRPLRDIELRFDEPQLLAEAEAVLCDLKQREARVVNEEGYRYRRRIMPCRTAEDRIEGVLITFTDITELGRALASTRRGEQQLRLLADALPALIAFVDSGHRFTFATAASADWLGRKPEALEGTRMEQALGARYDEQMGEHVDAALAGQQVAFDTELEHHELGRRHVNIIFVPETSDANESAAGFHLMVTDITHHKHQQKELVKEQRQFVRTSTNISLGEMASMLAHQLKQPLGAITGYTGALRRQLENRGGRPPELVDKIGNQARAASEIVDNLREFICERTLANDPLDINAILRRVVMLSENRTEAAGAAVTLDLDSGLPGSQGCRVQIEQALLNIVSNALEAMDASRRKRLTLTTHQVDGQLEIRISDTGEGIEQERLNQLFEPFFSTRADGMGMGLSICRTIVEDHDGAIWAESSRDGSTFVVRLPKSQESAP